MPTTQAETDRNIHWKKHIVRAGPHFHCYVNPPDPVNHREHIEPWLSTLFQAEHLNLLVGSGLTTAIADKAGVCPIDMASATLPLEFADAVDEAAQRTANTLGRRASNIEDQIRTVAELIGGLRIIACSQTVVAGIIQLLSDWQFALDRVLSSFLTRILATERGVDLTLTDTTRQGQAEPIRRFLSGFLLPFASRAATRERTHIFTTNYDRLIEFGCDLLGLRVVDRFVGNLAPVFHSSRLGIDLHYNPPGIRGEPRYLEGVVRLSKLHGSVDWRRALGPSGGIEVQRRALPFGATDSHPEVPHRPGEELLVYPNAAKDVETLEFPYAELFRDFAAAVCQPNAVVVTYGYGFGDDHVNRVLRDMLSIPSTHLVIISYDDADGRLQAFYERAGHEAQTTLLVGSHFGSLDTLVGNYLPKPAIDRTTWRMVDLLNRRARPKEDGRSQRGDTQNHEQEDS